MELSQRLREDLRVALKGGDKPRTDFLRFVLAGIHNAEIEKKRSLNDEEVISVLKKEAKRRKESIDMFRKGGRDDLATKEESELKFLLVYLPEEMDSKEVEKVVRDIVAKGTTEFTLVMRGAMQVLKGKADGHMVQEVVKRVLGG